MDPPTPPPPSTEEAYGIVVYLVVCGAACAGGVVKGLTGFGSAIICVLIWVCAKVLTIDPGPLSLTVVADSVSTLAAAVPLLIMTRAHRTADWRIVVTLLTFKSALSPLGAIMLVVLNKRVVELVMAIILIPVIVLTTNMHEEAPRLMRQMSSSILRSRRWQRRCADEDDVECQEAEALKGDAPDSAAFTNPPPSAPLPTPLPTDISNPQPSCARQLPAAIINPLPSSGGKLPFEATTVGLVALEANGRNAPHHTGLAIKADEESTATVEGATPVPLPSQPGTQESWSQQGGQGRSPQQGAQEGWSQQGGQESEPANGSVDAVQERQPSPILTVTFVAPPGVDAAGRCGPLQSPTPPINQHHHQSEGASGRVQASAYEPEGGGGPQGQSGSSDQDHQPLLGGTAGGPGDVGGRDAPTHPHGHDNVSDHSRNDHNRCNASFPSGQQQAATIDSPVPDHPPDPSPHPTSSPSHRHHRVTFIDTPATAPSHPPLPLAPPITTNTQASDIENMPLLTEGHRDSGDPQGLRDTETIGSDPDAAAHLNNSGNCEVLSMRAWHTREGCMQRVRWLWGAVVRYGRDAENRKVVGFGTLAGSVSGVMEGMTGMGGPPIMFLYRHLHVEKNVARGIGAVLNVFQIRMIAYIELGILRRQDALLLTIAAVLHLGGTVLGALVINKHVSQVRFMRLLVLLMCVCCVLLVAAAAGLAGS